LGGLEIDVEDTAEIIVRFASGALGHIHLDYVQRPPRHSISIIGRQGAIRWDDRDGAVHCHRASTGGAEVFAVSADFERNTMFLREMQHFLECIDGTESPICGLEDGVSALRWALGAKDSARESRVVQLG
jgi:predicted dehydrogenase